MDEKQDYSELKSKWEERKWTVRVMNVSKSIDGKQRIEMECFGQKGTGVGIANPVGSYPPELVLLGFTLTEMGASS